jgi:hypothetical protein
MAKLKCADHGKRVSFGRAGELFSITHRSNNGRVDCNSATFEIGYKSYERCELELLSAWPNPFGLNTEHR